MLGFGLLVASSTGACKLDLGMGTDRQHVSVVYPRSIKVQSAATQSEVQQDHRHVHEVK